MATRSSVVGLLALTLGISLACSGMELVPSSEGSPGDAPQGSASELRTGPTAIRRGAGNGGPRAAAAGAKRRRGQFSVKLADGVTELKLGKRVFTGDEALDGSFSALELLGSSYVHASHEPQNRSVAQSLGLDRTIRIRTNMPAEKVVRRLAAHPDVEWVEPVSEVLSAKPARVQREGKGGPRAKSEGRGGRRGEERAGKPAADGGTRDAREPDDPYWTHQWHMRRLDLPRAWQVTRGEGVVVAVLDTGVSSHQDGFYKLLPGKDFVDGDDDPSDPNGHGTHVAGTIGQRAHNGVGVVGVAPKVSILPVRVLDDRGAGANTAVASGILWAVDNGANIINLSLGSPLDSQVVADACAYAYENGVTVVAATGNEGFGDFVGFPAALDTTIAVGAIDQRDQVAFYSNRGAQVDVVAPGGDITVDTDGNGLQDGVVQESNLNGEWAYYFLQGTSMATPHVAGAAALLYANGVTDPDDIRSLLRSTAQDLGPEGWDPAYGAGLVAPAEALRVRPRDRRRRQAKGGLITGHRVRSMEGDRAVIAWLTAEPAETYVSGPDGFQVYRKELTKVHRVSVRGEGGTASTFTLGSRAGGDRDRRQVTVQF